MLEVTRSRFNGHAEQNVGNNSAFVASPECSQHEGRRRRGTVRRGGESGVAGIGRDRDYVLRKPSAAPFTSQGPFYERCLKAALDRSWLVFSGHGTDGPVEPDSPAGSLPKRRNFPVRGPDSDKCQTTHPSAAKCWRNCRNPGRGRDANGAAPAPRSAFATGQ